MYKQLKRQLDDKKILDTTIKAIDERIESIIHKQLGLKGTSYTDIKLELTGQIDDKYARAFSKVESLDKDKKALVEERKIIIDFIDDVYKSINNMNNLELNVFKCRYILGLSNKDTAERLHFSIQRIKQLNKKIIQKMKD